LRQKLKYRDQIENGKMTPGIIVTRGTIMATWYDVSLICDNFLIFLKIKKIKNSKNPETNTWHPV